MLLIINYNNENKCTNKNNMVQIKKNPIINIDYKNWFTPFSYKLDNYKNYKEEYDINVDNVKTLLKKLAFDREDNSYGKFFKYDYYQYLGSNKRKNY